ncbi:MAG TPA: hypothetical protein PKH28_01975, partial [Candidatus Competibacteraceae bacterium]|nr:hypothetical protein [Candidatus Competibacteraceae bacterium]
MKLAMGLVATMAALLLGLLVSSAKNTYDAERAQVIQLSAKLTFLDRILSDYGPEAAAIRVQVRSATEEAIRQIWPEEKALPPQLITKASAGDTVYFALQRLVPRDDIQSNLKTQAIALAIEIAQLRALLVAQATPSISKPMLIVVIAWLVAIFLSFSLFAPPNATASLALLVAVTSVSGAIFLILELDRPFGGLIALTSEPLL